MNHATEGQISRPPQFSFILILEESLDLNLQMRAVSAIVSVLYNRPTSDGEQVVLIPNKQLDRAPLRYRSAEHGPACLARSARSQTIGRFAPS